MVMKTMNVFIIILDFLF